MPGFGRTAAAVLAMLLTIKATASESVTDLSFLLSQQPSLMQGIEIESQGQVVGPPNFLVGFKCLIVIIEPGRASVCGSRYQQKLPADCGTKRVHLRGAPSPDEGRLHP